MYVLSMLSDLVLLLPLRQSTARMVRVNKMIFLICHVSGSLLQCVQKMCNVLIAHVHIAMTMKIRFIVQPYKVQSAI